MTTITHLSVSFPSEAHALGAAQALAAVNNAAREAAGETPPEGGWPVLDGFPPDGETLGEDGQWHYYAIAPIGEVHAPGTEDTPGEVQPGYHFKGVWFGPLDTVPAALRALHTPLDERPEWWPR
jgi:hypothetical protein